MNRVRIEHRMGNINCELRGRLRHIQVGRDRPLLPVFEAVSNAFHSIGEARKNLGEGGLIKVNLLRAPSLLPEVAGDLMGFEVIDDGIGFDPENYESFCTADSVRKERIGGKGVGRFTYLKVFSEARIDSTYMELGVMRRRTFKFNVDFEASASTLQEVPIGDRRTSIKLIGIDPGFTAVLPQSASSVAEEIVEHCLPMLMRSDAPTITVVDDEVIVNLNDIFSSYHADNSQESLVTVRDNKLRITVFRGKPGEHKLNLCAHGRQVRSEKLAKKMPGLPNVLGSPSYSVKCYVQGEVLDKNVDMSRSSFTLPAAEGCASRIIQAPNNR